MTSTILITGATRGLGLAAAHAAAARGAHVLVAGRDQARTDAAARAVGGEPVLLDLASLASVRTAVAGLPHVDAVACNAGLQLTGPPARTADGLDETMQVNVVGHVALVDALLTRERPPTRVVFIGSGTHDPAQPTPGLPKPPELDAAALLAADFGDDGKAGRQRYSTSKLLTTALAYAYGRERPGVAGACLDPGLMTGTGLARDYPAPVARLYNLLERPLALLPFANTAAQSGDRLAALLADEPMPASAPRISERAADPAFQDEVLAACRALLKQRGVDVAAREDDAGARAVDAAL